MSDILQVWSAIPCESGAYALGAIPRWEKASGTEALGTAPSFALSCPLYNNGTGPAALAVGRILRVLSQSRGERFWLIASVDVVEGKGETLINVKCSHIRELFALRGLVRDTPVAGGPENYSFTPERVTATVHAENYIFTNLAADNLDWNSIGTIEYTPPFQLGAFSRARRGAVMDNIETQTGYRWVERYVYSGTTLTGVEWDLLADPASTTAVRTLEVGGAITTLNTSQELRQAPTVAVPFTASGGGMEHTTWIIGTLTGAGPYRVPLTDPEGGPNPIREDDQLVGAYLLASDGTTHEILDSFASDSAVSVAANTGLSAGGEVSFVIDTSGRPVTQLTSPSGLAGSRGRVIAEVTTQSPHAKRNWVLNPLMEDWTDAFTPESWTDEGGTFNVAEYPRDTAATVSGVLVNGAHSAGAAGVNFKNAPAGFRFFQHEYFVVGSAPYRVGNVVAEASGSGTGSIVFLTGTLPAPLSDGDAITFFGQAPKRPTSFPEGEQLTNNVMRLLTNSATTAIPPAASALRMQSAPITIKYAAGWETLTCTAAFTIVGGTSTIGNRDSGSAITDDISAATIRGLPAVMLVDTSGPTRLAYAICPTSVAIDATSHQTVSCSYTMTADKTVAVALLSIPDVFNACRYVTLSLGSGTIDAPLARSGSNLLHHRAQDVLATRTNAGRFRITGADLRALLADEGPLVLGQLVRVRSERTDATLRVVQMSYTLGESETLSLEVGALTPKLTSVTVSL